MILVFLLVFIAHFNSSTDTCSRDFEDSGDLVSVKEFKYKKIVFDPKQAIAKRSGGHKEFTIRCCDVPRVTEKSFQNTRKETTIVFFFLIH
jgi:hypothetical protein